MLFASVVPRDGFAHEHGSQELRKDVQHFGHHEVILTCGGKPALRSVQEEAKRRRPAPMILQNAGVGDDQVERAVQAPGEQAHVLRQ